MTLLCLTALQKYLLCSRAPHAGQQRSESRRTACKRSQLTCIDGVQIRDPGPQGLGRAEIFCMQVRLFMSGAETVLTDAANPEELFATADFKTRCALPQLYPPCNLREPWPG